MTAGTDIGKGYRTIEHPSDVGIEAFGASMSEAFEQAAWGMMSVIVEACATRAADEKIVVLRAASAEQLLVQWLSEVLYLYDGEHFLPAHISIDMFTDGGLRAVVAGETFDRSRHHARVDVKAVTYHQIAVDAAANSVRVFLDI